MMDFQPVTGLCLFVFIAVWLNDSILSDNDLLSVLNIDTRLGGLCIQLNAVDGIPCIRSIIHSDRINSRRIFHIDREIFCNIESIPLVIYSDNLTTDSISWFVVIIIE